MSIDEYTSTTPINLPIVNRNTNPSVQKQAALYVIWVLYIIASHLKILIPVGKTMIIVAHIKYAHVSSHIPTVVTSFIKQKQQGNKSRKSQINKITIFLKQQHS
jgi:hypothetical protein